MERLPARLDGPVPIAPALHGDWRGFFMIADRLPF
jgi:hypothetical protein